MGLAFIADAVTDLIWGADAKQVDPPTAVHVYRLSTNATFNTRDVYATIIGAAALSLTLAFFRFSDIGTRMRAAAESPVLASQTGIRVAAVFTLGWAISCGLAAVGGMTFTMTTVLDPTGTTIGLLALTPVLLGGLDGIGGVLIGSIVAALASNFTVIYLGAASIDAMAGVVLLLVLLIRPYGLFGTKAIVRV